MRSDPSADSGRRPVAADLSGDRDRHRRSACSSTTPTGAGSPSNPQIGPTSPLVGTWKGTISSAVIATGSLTVTFDLQAGTAEFPLLAGSYEAVFPDAAFSAKGNLSAGLDRPGGTNLGMFFDSAPVPCPGQVNGAAQVARTAVVTLLSNSRARGDYLAGSCPGGTIDLTKQ